MEAGQASRTALGAALYRAAHQVMDHPLVLVDPLARRLVGPGAAQGLRDATDDRVTRSGLRALLVVRSRYAEDCLADAYARGIRQYVLVGAGLDTFAYRNPFPELRVFEVDHPASQADKRRRLADAGITVPASVTYVPVDLETEPLVAALTGAGFRVDEPAVLAMLGVVPYLSLEALTSTLTAVVTLAAGSSLVFDYLSSAGAETADQRAAVAVLRARVARVGEPMSEGLDPAVLQAIAEELGFGSLVDLGRDELNARYLADRTDGLSLRGKAHLAHLTV